MPLYYTTTTFFSGYSRQRVATADHLKRTHNLCCHLLQLYIQLQMQLIKFKMEQKRDIIRGRVKLDQGQLKIDH